MSAKEAAALWGCGWQTVKRLLREGRVEGAYKVGYTWVIPDGALRPLSLPRGPRAIRAEAPAPVREDRAVLRALAADKLADVLLADPGAGWARYALEVVLKQPAEAP